MNISIFSSRLLRNVVPLAGSIAALALATPEVGVAAERTVQIGGFSLTVPDAELPAQPASAGSKPQAGVVEVGATQVELPVEKASDFLVLNGTGESTGSGIQVLKAASTGLMTPSQNTFSQSSGGGDLSDRITVGGHGGLPTFFGTSLGWRFSDHFGVRSGFDWFSFSRSQSLSDLKYSVKLKMQSEPLFVDLYPWQNRSFRLNAGVLFNQNSLSGSLTPAPGTQVDIGGVFYSAADVGSIHLKFKQKPVCPIVTLGGNLFYFDSAHQWGVSTEIGAYFAGKPKIEYSTTSVVPSVIQSLADERDSLNRGIGNKLNIIPVIRTGITFSF